VRFYLQAFLCLLLPSSYPSSSFFANAIVSSSKVTCCLCVSRVLSFLRFERCLCSEECFLSLLGDDFLVLLRCDFFVSPSWCADFALVALVLLRSTSERPAGCRSRPLSIRPLKPRSDTKCARVPAWRKRRSLFSFLFLEPCSDPK